CLLLENPTGIPVRFNLSVSFTETVFVQEFTSPEKPGGSNSTNLATNN
ncbi:7272_t:CDS:1, partial [Funneliformis mosseae]